MLHKENPESREIFVKNLPGHFSSVFSSDGS